MIQILWGLAVSAIQVILFKQQDFRALWFSVSKSQQQPLKLTGKVLKALLFLIME